MPEPSHAFILSAGHRNVNRGGARGELEWTYPATVMLRDAIVARGGKAIIAQEHDGDRDPSDSIGRGLQNVAVLCTQLAKQHGPFDAYISMHYNGDGRGFHAIFPDSRGGGDTKADNPADVRLCRRMRDAVKATGTVPMLGWTADSPGVMSERETGVGEQGGRLGEFVGTIGFRDVTARVILEAGGINTADRQFIQDPRWVRHVYCEAIVDALQAEFGAFRKPAEQPIPVPEPQKPAPAYAIPDPAPWADPLLDGTATSVVAPDRTRWFALPPGTMYRAKRDTPRKQYSADGSRVVGPPIPAGAVFGMAGVGTNTTNNAIGLTVWKTRVNLDDLEIVVPTEQPDLLPHVTSLTTALAGLVTKEQVA